MNTTESRFVSKTSSKQMGLILAEFVILASNACSGRVSIGANTCAVHHGVVGFSTHTSGVRPSKNIYFVTVAESGRFRQVG